MHVEVVIDDRGNDPFERVFALATPEAAVVVSAATLRPVGGCGHGRGWFLRRLGVHLLARMTDRPDRGIAECLADCVAETAALHGARCDLADADTPSAAVAALRLTGDRLQHLVLAGGVVLLGHADGPPSRVTGPEGPAYAVRAWPGVAYRAVTGTVPRHALTGVELASDPDDRPRAVVRIEF